MATAMRARDATTACKMDGVDGIIVQNGQPATITHSPSGSLRNDLALAKRGRARGGVPKPVQEAFGSAFGFVVSHRNSVVALQSAKGEGGGQTR
jgi:hypothetical protein